MSSGDRSDAIPALVTVPPADQTAVDPPLEIACDRLRQAWQPGCRLIEELVASAPADRRAFWLRRLLAIEIGLARGSGDQGDLEPLRSRFPSDADTVRAAWDLANQTRVSWSSRPSRPLGSAADAVTLSAAALAANASSSAGSVGRRVERLTLRDLSTTEREELLGAEKAAWETNFQCGGKAGADKAAEALRREKLLRERLGMMERAYGSVLEELLELRDAVRIASDALASGMQVLITAPSPFPTGTHSRGCTPAAHRRSARLRAARRDSSASSRRRARPRAISARVARALCEIARRALNLAR